MWENVYDSSVDDGLMNFVVSEASAECGALNYISAFTNSSVLSAVEEAETKLELYNLLCSLHLQINRKRFVFAPSEGHKSSPSAPIAITNWPFELFEKASQGGLLSNLVNSNTPIGLDSGGPYSSFEVARVEQFINDDLKSAELTDAIGFVGLENLHGFAIALESRTEAKLFGLVEGTPPQGEAECQSAEAFYRIVGEKMQYFQAQERATTTGLSKRETECIRWTAEGKTSYEIGIILGLSENTINNYIASVTKKMGAVNRSHMISLAFRSGIIK